MASKIERINIPLPKGFDPARHLKALEGLIRENHGDGWEIDHIDPSGHTATASRQATITEVSTAVSGSGSRRETFTVRLPRGTKPSDGERVAARFEDQYPGAYLTTFEPFLGTAVITRLTNEEARCRGAVSVALGVKPWEVQVRARRGGGFDLELPKTYVPSKHNDKLDEVATQIIGQDGWYVDINAAKLTATIMPGEPPTFAPVLPYPFEKLKSADETKLLIGRALSERADREGHDAYIDFDAEPHVQVSGTSGSGKRELLTNRVPVPLSERFKDGWAAVGDLRAGDVVFAADGSQTVVTDLSPIAMGDVYEIVFDDGQRVRCDSEHLWKITTHESRAAHSSANAHSRQRRRGDFDERIAHIREAAFAASKTRAQANVAAIADMLGVDQSGLARFAKSSSLPSVIAHGPAVNGRVRPSRQYQVDEFLYAYADHQQRIRDSHPAMPLHRVVSTQEIARLLEQGSRPGVSLAAPVACDDVELPVSPYLFGAWLGDGSSHTGVITVGRQDLSEMSGILAAEWPDIASRPSAKRPGSSLLVFRRPDEHACPKGHSDFTYKKRRSGRYARHKPVRVCRSCRRSDPNDGVVRETLTTKLDRLGVLRNKHIPPEYLRASVEQRVALLQGLMDSDGTVTAGGWCAFTNTNRQLADDVLELVQSLGIKAFANEYAAAVGSGQQRRACGTVWHVGFTTDLPVFRLRRKAARIKSSISGKSSHRFIKSVTRVSSELSRCIRVDHPEHLYLTAGFIPTHNTVTLNAMITYSLASGAELVICDVPHKQVDFLDFKKFVRPGGWGCADPTSPMAVWLPEALTALGMVYDEGMRRAGLLAKYNVTKIGDIPARERPKPILVVCDEVTGMLQLDDVPKGVPKDHPIVAEANQNNLMRQMMLSYMKKIAAELRFAGIRMVLSSQVSSVNTGIPTALRMNLTNKLLLGANPTDGNRKLSLADADSVPTVPDNVKADGKASKGVGVAELEGQRGQVIKSFYAPSSDFVKALDRLGVPTTDRPRPTRREVDKYTPALDEPEDKPPARAGHAGNDYGYTQQSDAEFLRDFDNKAEGGFARANAARRELDRAAGTARSKPVEMAQAGPVTVTRVADRNNPYDQSSAQEMCGSCSKPINAFTGECPGCSR